MQFSNSNMRIWIANETTAFAGRRWDLSEMNFYDALHIFQMDFATFCAVVEKMLTFRENSYKFADFSILFHLFSIWKWHFPFYMNFFERILPLNLNSTRGLHFSSPCISKLPETTKIILIKDRVIEHPRLHTWTIKGDELNPLHSKQYQRVNRLTLFQFDDSSGKWFSAHNK